MNAKVLRSYTFFFPDITCASCTSAIESVVKTHKNKETKEPPIICNDPAVNLATKSTTIVVEEDSITDPNQTQDALKKIFNDAGWDVVFDLVETDPRPFWLKGFLGISIAVVMMILMLLDIEYPHEFATGVGGALTLYLGRRFYTQSLYKFWKMRFVNMDTLFALSTFAAIVVTVLHHFIPGLPMLIDAALMTLGFAYIGKAIKASMENIILEKISLTDNIPKEVKRENSDALVSVADLKVGDIIYVFPGQCIPCDGICLDNEFSVDKGTFNGDNGIPVSVQKNQEVFAGMMVYGNQTPTGMKMRVTKTLADSEISQMERDSQAALGSQSCIEANSKEWLRYFIPLVLFIAAVVGISSAVFVAPEVGIAAGLYLLVCACPCVLGMIPYLAMNVGLSKARDKGIFFKSAKHLETASRVNRVALDLTGTITENSLSVFKYAGLSNDDLAVIALGEAESTHAIGKAIYAYCKNKSNLQITTEKIDQPSSNGIVIKSNFVEYKIGNENYVGGVADHQKPDEKTQGQYNVIYVKKNEEIIGYFLLQAELKKDAKSTIDALKASGKEVWIITGSPHAWAVERAKELGVDEAHVKADLSPKQKTAEIETLKENDRYVVAMVGDGINDISVLPTSHLGVCIDPNASKVKAAANVYFNSTALAQVLVLFTVADKTMAHINQNIALSMLYNVLVLGFVLASIVAYSEGEETLFEKMLNPAYGAGLMAVQSLCVLGNTWLFKQREQGRELCQNLNFMTK